MKIDSNKPVQSAKDVKKRSGASSSGGAGGAFEKMLQGVSSGGASAPEAVSQSGPVSSVDSVLALQEVSGEEAKRKEAVRDGNNMLDSLDKLRRNLLMGAIPVDVLYELEGRLARQRSQTSDPRLIEIIDDIELRVAVEKAKLEMALRKE